METSTPTRAGSTPQHAHYFRPRRLGHVNLVISDLDASMRFYNTVIGLEEVYRVPAIQGGFLSNGNTHHDVGMVGSSGPSGRGRAPSLNHLAFELETEVDLVLGYERAVQDGVIFQRTLDHDIAHSAYCADPDGTSCELYADVVRDWRNARTGVVTKPKPAWKPGLTVPHAERNYEQNPEIRRVDHAIFHPLRTKHATLEVSSLENSVRFYRDIIGLDLLVHAPRRGYALLGGTCGERNIALVQNGDGQPASMHHFGVELASEAELEASVDALRSRGLAAEREVKHPLRRAVYVADPDGLRVQLFVDRSSNAADWAAVEADQALWVL